MPTPFIFAIVGSSTLILHPTLLRAPPIRACSPNDLVDNDLVDACDAEEQYCVTASGIRYIDDEMGNGDEAAAGSVVRVSYVASLMGSGQRIGSKTRFTFALNEPSQLVFWEEAVTGMKVGGRRRLLVPPSAKMNLRDRNQRVIVPEGETIRFDCRLIAIEEGISAKLYLSGLVGAGGGGRLLRAAVLLLSLIPYLLPEESRPALWQSGSTTELLQAQGLLPEVSESAPPSLVQQRRLTRDERSADAALFGTDVFTDVERSLYGP